MTCRYDRDLGYRVASSGEPCTQRHCCVGRCWNHCDDVHPQTCPECVGLVRDHLAEIIRLTELLPHQAVDGGCDGRLLAGAPIPGGEAMVLLAPGSAGAEDQRARHRGLDRLGYPAWLGYAVDESLNLAGDPTPPLLLLATWEDDWRQTLGHQAGPRATMWRCADYLGTHLTMMAQRHEAFDEFAADLARCRVGLEDVLGEGERDEGGAPCQECGGLLLQVVAKRRVHRHCNGHGPLSLCRIPGPAGCCDVGGLTDYWECSRCHTTYTAAEYWKAVERDYQDNASALHAEAIERRTGVAIGTIRVWVTRGKVRTRGKDERGRVLYDVADVERHAEGEVA